MKILISRAEFSRRAGIAPSTTTKACKKALAPATSGRKIDINPPAAIAYLNKRTGNTTTVNGWTARNEVKKLAALETLKNESLADMTLHELVAKYGTDTAFSDWLKSVRIIEDINEKRLKNTQTIGELVNVQLVKNGVVKPFDMMCDKLLTDGAKTTASRVTTMSGAGRSVEDCEVFVADQVSSFIKLFKAESLGGLTSVELSKY